MNVREAFKGIAAFFGDDAYQIGNMVRHTEVRGQKETGDDCSPFDHCYVDQHRIGLSDDDFHGTVFFHIGDGDYIAATYPR